MRLSRMTSQDRILPKRLKIRSRSSSVIGKKSALQLGEDPYPVSLALCHRIEFANKEHVFWRLDFRKW